MTPEMKNQTCVHFTQRSQTCSAVCGGQVIGLKVLTIQLQIQRNIEKYSEAIFKKNVITYDDH